MDRQQRRLVPQVEPDSSNSYSQQWKEPVRCLYLNVIFPQGFSQFSKDYPFQRKVRFKETNLRNWKPFKLSFWRILLSHQRQPSYSRVKRATPSSTSKGDFSSEVPSNFQVWKLIFLQKFRSNLWKNLPSRQEESSSSRVKRVIHRLNMIIHSSSSDLRGIMDNDWRLICSPGVSLKISR